MDKKELPENWEVKKLGELCQFEYGKGLTKKNRDENGIYNVYGSNGVVGKHSEYLIEEPCIIVGRKGAAGEVHLSLNPCWAIDTTYFVRKPSYFELKFLYFQLKNLNLQSLDKSTAIPGLNRNDAYAKKAVLPPLPEQERIVAKIEELFSELDAGIENLKTAHAQLKAYRQAVLKYAFEGKFTEAWRKQKKKVVKVNKLLSEIKIIREKNALDSGKKIKSIASLSKEEIDQLPEIPSEWMWCRNEELLDYVTSGSRDWKQYYSDKGAMFIRTQDINTNVLNFENIARVDLPKKVEGKRSFVEIDDLLMTITGANVGKIAHIDKEIEEAYVSQSVALIRYINKSFARFLYYYLQAKGFGGSMIEQMVYGVGRPVLSLENMRDVPVCFCPLEEQQLIVEEIESRLSVCDKLEETIHASLAQSEALRQSILKKAFEGKLVTQDENDEPASVLLERIKEEREAFLEEQKLQKKKTTKKKKSKTMAEELKSILKLLEEKGEPINAQTLWQSSEHKDDIDKFYAEVKKLVDEGKIKETDREGKDSFLALAATK